MYKHPHQRRNRAQGILSKYLVNANYHLVNISKY